MRRRDRLPSRAARSGTYATHDVSRGLAGRFSVPPGMPSPVLWGDEDVARERFGAGVSDLRLTRVTYRFDYRFTPAEVVGFFRQYYGPTTRACAALEAERPALRAELVDLWASHNQASEPARTIVAAEYLEVVGVRA